MAGGRQPARRRYGRFAIGMAAETAFAILVTGGALVIVQLINWLVQ